MEYALYRISQAFFDSRTHDQTVHNDLNIMFDIFFQRNVLRQFIHISVYTDTDIAAFLRTFQKLCMCSLAAAHNRRQKLYPGSLGK